MNAWEVVTDIQSLCGEGPVWDSETSSIFWIDIVVGDIHRYNTKNNKYASINVGQKIGAIAKCSDGQLIAALKTGIYLIDFDNGTMKLITDPERNKPENRFNDGKCDPEGRFWVGSMTDSGAVYKAGSLYAIEKDYSVSKKQEGLTIPNGLCWSLDKKQFYLIDTPTRKVVVFDYDNIKGEITNKREVITISTSEGFPDGMTIDSEGMLWIAHWGGWKVSRWNPIPGVLLYEVHLPVAQVTSCTFGGDRLEDIYITSAKLGLTDEDMENQPLAGSLFVLKNSGFIGVADNEFKS